MKTANKLQSMINKTCECEPFQSCARCSKMEIMLKKYRVDIPEMINKRDAIIADDFKTVEKVIEFGGPSQDPPGYLCVEAPGGIITGVPKEWLEEIKPNDLVSAAEWVDWYAEEFPTNRNNEKCKMQIAFKAGEENQKKRNRPKQIFDVGELCLEFQGLDGNLTFKRAIEFGHRKTLKSHGWESED